MADYGIDHTILSLYHMWLWQTLLAHTVSVSLKYSHIFTKLSHHTYAQYDTHDSCSIEAIQGEVLQVLVLSCCTLHRTSVCIKLITSKDHEVITV